MKFTPSFTVFLYFFYFSSSYLFAIYDAISLNHCAFLNTRTTCL